MTTEPQSVTMTARDLHTLLAAVRPLTSRDRAFPVLCAVLVETVGKHVTATAVDRYVLGVQRVTPEAEPTPGFRVLIDRSDAKTALRALKSLRVNLAGAAATITVEPGDNGRKVTISAHNGARLGDSVSVTFLEAFGEFPPLQRILAKGADELIPTPPERTRIDLQKLRQFTKAWNLNSDLQPAQFFTTTLAEKSPLFVTIGTDFLGCVMPVNDLDVAKQQRLIQSWADMYPPVPEPADVEVGDRS